MPASPAVDKAVLWAMAHRTDNETGACHPSILTISKESGASKTIVKQVIAYCMETGILGSSARKNGNVSLANEYTFNLQALRWLERADSRFGPDGETDTGLRANVGKLPPQGASQPTGGLVSGPGVYRRPAQGWGGSRLQNSLMNSKENSELNSSGDSSEQTEQQASPETTGEAPDPLSELAHRLNAIVQDPDWEFVSEGDVRDMIQSQNGKGHLVVPALTWFLNENDAKRVHVHFPKLKPSIRIMNYKLGLVSNLPRIIEVYEQSRTQPHRPGDGDALTLGQSAAKRFGT